MTSPSASFSTDLKQPQSKETISIRNDKRVIKQSLQDFEFTVVGAGPGGLAAVSNLIDRNVSRIAWVDLEFEAGMIGSLYREVPSNTKVQTFLDSISQSPTLSELVKSSKTAPNPYTILKENFEPDKGIALEHFANLIKFLSSELIHQRPGILKSFRGRVEVLRFKDERKVWEVEVLRNSGALLNENGEGLIRFESSRIVLSIGSKPIEPPEPNIVPEIDLEVALSPKELEKILKTIDRPGNKIGVVGSSHSAILVLSNLERLSRDLEIIHIFRSPLKFAEFLEDGSILFDNTGLKGFSADWARTIYPSCNRIKKIQLKNPEFLSKPTNNNEKDDGEGYQKYEKSLRECCFSIYAIGYKHIEPPKIFIGEREIDKIDSLDFDNLNGKFKGLEGLYGCGIGFPELVCDRSGNKEHAVGFFKFMRSVKKFSEGWVK